ncbi:MAG TPA: hypothetical protein PK948_09270 [Gemmatimonadales bacterium]|nr:hypothetical protein [Gemmatimonadales bacterium]
MFVPRMRATTLGFAFILTAAPLAAQVSFSPTIGAYLPTSNLVDVVVGTDSLAELKQDVGLALGANLGIGLSSRLAIQVAGSYVPSQLSGTVTGAGTFTQSDANLFFGNANITFFVVKPTSPVWLAVNTGGSMVSRSGAAYDGVSGTTDYGGLVGATLGFHLGSLLSFNVSATDYIYGAQFEKDGYTTKETTQNDILLGLGLGIPLGGKKAPPMSNSLTQ